jgi:succinate dehydrogenase/fumarate reductase cytochrome b subunit
MGGFNGLLGLLILIGDVWAIVNIAQSSESSGAKAIWIVIVLVLPLLGLIIWWFAGPKSATG